MSFLSLSQTEHNFFQLTQSQLYIVYEMHFPFSVLFQAICVPSWGQLEKHVQKLIFLGHFLGEALDSIFASYATSVSDLLLNI